MYCGDEISSLVFDIGSFNSRFGYSGEDSPKYVFQSQVGNYNNTNYFIGEHELRYYKPDVKVSSPINNQGYIENQETFELMINHVYSKSLKIESKEHPVLFSEPGIHNKENRSLLCQIMFEKFEIPAIFVCKNPVLSAFSCGRSTCLVFDSGSNSTWASPVHDGYVLYKTQLKNDIAGNYISNEVSKLIHNKNVKVVPHYKFTKEPKEDDENSFTTKYLDIPPQQDSSYELFWIKENIRDVKESILSFSDESFLLGNKEMISPYLYELPDGTNINFGNERFAIQEKLFSQSNPGFNGYHSMVIDSINKGDVDIKKEMYSSIFVCGGNTLFQGFPEYLQNQIMKYAPSNIKIKVLTHPSPTERKFSSWIGGSILSSLGTFHQIWFSKQEYEEHGPVLIERKCA